MNRITRIAAATLVAGCALPAFAVPALRSVQTVTQPDGTTLRITKIGDEFRHFTLTEDGILLACEADGTYCYARTDASGIVESLGVKAMDASLRASVPSQAMRVSDLQFAKMARSPRRIPQSGVGLDNTSFPGKGSPNVLIILVEYSDVSFNTAYDNADPQGYFKDMLNKEGFSQYNATGSCKDYFTENSKGQFTPHFDLYGPVKLPHNRSYYGANNRYGEDERAYEMVVDAINILDPEVDFSKYDNDGDGKVDNVYVIYAGQGEASYGPDESVWPHSWDLSRAQVNLEADGVTIDHYACSNEWKQNRPDGIGTFVHEFSHVLGLPDLYTTDGNYNANWTPDSYSVMDYGPYNNDGCTPPAYSIYERNSLQWIDLEVIDGPMDCKLEHILDSNKGYLIPTEKDNEFFLLENRQQKGWDKFIPGHGMLVWHIDFNASVWANNTVNNEQSHQYVDIEEAGGRLDKSDIIQASYPFPGTFNKTEFTDDTKPSMKSWSGKGQELPITQITETDGIVTFLVDGGSGISIKAPVPHEADKIETGDGYFVAAWEPVDNATDYEVCAYAAGQGEPEVVSCDMGSGKTLTLSDGWSSSSIDVYSSAGNFGESSPSLKLSSTDAYILSPEFKGNVTEISYWRKGQSTDGVSELKVLGLINSEWVEIHSETPEASKADVIKLTDIPSGVKQVKFQYTKSRGNLAIDDIVIASGAGDELLPGFENVSTGGQTSLRVSPLLEGCTSYRFKVRALGDNKISRYSQPVTVTVNTVGISAVENGTSGKAEYFDMLGRKVLRPEAGSILIERRDGKARKVIVR